MRAIPHSLPAFAVVLAVICIVGQTPTLTTAATTHQSGSGSAQPRNLIILDDDTWRQVLQGEWMIQFHAPWCPACRAMVDGWNELARLSAQLDIKVAKADVTVSPALSGRFFITALPTILYVKNGEFHQYRGPRDVQTMQRMITERKWHHMDAISAWKHPDSLQMTVVAYFFRLSHGLKELNAYLQETYRMPVWLTYALFAMVTITLGALIGLLFVCIVDYIVPPRRKTFDELERDGNTDEMASDDLEVDEPAGDSTSEDELYSGADSELEEEKQRQDELADRRKKVLDMKYAILDGKVKSRDGKKIDPMETASEINVNGNGDEKESPPNSSDARKRKSRKAD